MTRYAGVMSMERYREMLSEAPAIREADYATLATFWPRYPKMRQLIRIAYAWWYG